MSAWLRSTRAVSLGLLACGGGADGPLQTSVGSERSDSQGASVDARETAGTNVPPVASLRGVPLEAIDLPHGPWLASFQSGVDGDERLWLLPEQGDPVDVSIAERPSADRPWAYSIPGGSIDDLARVGTVAHDSIRDWLFSTWIVGDEYQLRSLDLATGRWTLWAQQPGRPQFDVSPAGALVILPGRTQGQVHAEVDGRFTLVPFADPLRGGDGSPGGSFPRIRFARVSGERDVVMVEQRVFERDAGRFRRLDLGGGELEQVVIRELNSAGTHACGLSDGRMWLYAAGGAMALDVPDPRSDCRFSPAGDHVAVLRGYGSDASTHFFDLGGVEVLRYPGEIRIGPDGDEVTYATVDDGVARIDWARLQITLAWDRSGEAQPPPGWTGTVRDLGESLLVTYGADCIDCDDASHYLVPLDGGAPRALPEAGNRWLYDFQLVPGGGALIVAGGTGEADRVRRFDAKGNPSDLGPFDGVSGPLHELVLLR